MVDQILSNVGTSFFDSNDLHENKINRSTQSLDKVSNQSIAIAHYTSSTLNQLSKTYLNTIIANIKLIFFKIFTISNAEWRFSSSDCVDRLQSRRHAHICMPGHDFYPFTTWRNPPRAPYVYTSRADHKVFYLGIIPPIFSSNNDS